jgi:hypothetical protein
MHHSSNPLSCVNTLFAVCITTVFTIPMVFPVWTFAEPVTITLQRGAGGYTGCSDRELRNTEGNFGEGPDTGLLVVSEL